MSAERRGGTGAARAPPATRNAPPRRRCRRSRPRSPTRRARSPRSSSAIPRSSSRSARRRDAARERRASCWRARRSGASGSTPRSRELAAPVDDADRARRRPARAGKRRPRRRARQRSTALRDAVQALQEAHTRSRRRMAARRASALADREARARGARGAAGEDRQRQGLPRLAGTRTASTSARRLWQQTRHRAGLGGRARSACCASGSNALELPRARRALAGWTGGGGAAGPHRAPMRRAAARQRTPASRRCALAARKVRVRQPELDARCWPTGCAACAAATTSRRALRDRECARRRRSLRDPGGPSSSPRRSVGLFAPDSELHGVLARQRELAELEHAICVGACRDRARRGERARDRPRASSRRAQQEYHGESMALSLAAAALPRSRARAAAAEAGGGGRASSGAAQIADELASAAPARNATEHDAQAAIDARGRRHGSSALHDEVASAMRARHAQTKRKSRWLAAASASRGGGARGAGSRIRRALVPRAHRRARAAARGARRAGRAAAGAARAAGDRAPAAIDWTPVEQALQAQLVTRGGAEQALAAARDRQRGDRRASCAQPRKRALPRDQKLEPRARDDRGDAAQGTGGRRCPERNIAEQLAEAHADLAALPEQLKAWGRASALPAEIERLHAGDRRAGRGQPRRARRARRRRASARTTSTRRRADLTEAMTTLGKRDPADRPRIARSCCSRPSTPSTRTSASCFPTLFGGGQARLVLTGEEILDSGVQVLAQPPGKRNTSIHLLSGGEKALTAIALVFALFQLNPAPFCLLDEVDAPLDDPNTDRFCALVRDDGRARRSSCSSATTRSRWRWRTSSSGSRCPSRASRASSPSTSPRRSSSPETRAAVGTAGADMNPLFVGLPRRRRRAGRHRRGRLQLACRSGARAAASRRRSRQPRGRRACCDARAGVEPRLRRAGGSTAVESRRNPDRRPAPTIRRRCSPKRSPSRCRDVRPATRSERRSRARRRYRVRRDAAACAAGARRFAGRCASPPNSPPSRCAGSGGATRVAMAARSTRRASRTVGGDCRVHAARQSQRRGDVAARSSASIARSASSRTRCRRRVAWPDPAAEAARAEALDRFCADLDVQIGLDDPQERRRARSPARGCAASPRRRASG